MAPRGFGAFENDQGETMRKLVGMTTLVAALGLVGCGDDGKPDGRDPDNKKPIKHDFLVETKSGRTFVGPPLDLRITQHRDDPPSVFGLVEALESETDHAFYFNFVASESMLLDGAIHLTLSGKFPENPGAGKIEIDHDGGTRIADPSKDTIVLHVAGGEVLGSLKTLRTDVLDFEADITGRYALRCESLQQGVPVPDPDFSTEFCQTYAHLRAPPVIVESSSGSSL